MLDPEFQYVELLQPSMNVVEVVTVRGDGLQVRPPGMRDLQGKFRRTCIPSVGHSQVSVWSRERSAGYVGTVPHRKRSNPHKLRESLTILKPPIRLPEHTTIPQRHMESHYRGHMTAST